MKTLLWWVMTLAIVVNIAAVLAMGWLLFGNV